MLNPLIFDRLQVQPIPKDWESTLSQSLLKLTIKGIWIAYKCSSNINWLRGLLKTPKRNKSFQALISSPLMESDKTIKFTQTLNWNRIYSILNSKETWFWSKMSKNRDNLKNKPSLWKHREKVINCRCIQIEPLKE